MAPLTPAGRSLAPDRSLCVICFAFLPFRLQPPGVLRHRFDALPFSVTDFPARPEERSAFRCSSTDLGFATWQQARRDTRPNRVHLRCGLAVRLPVLPTSSRDDAVPVGYKPESVYLKRTFTFLTKHTYRRTATGSARQSQWHTDQKLHLPPLWR